jgi:type IV secretory pathway VirD2 relaxase
MVNRWAEDQHSFRFIISPEGGAKLDLEEYTKRVIRAVEKDLGTTLQWFGVCHYNTDNPHAHVVIRGVDERGMPLRMSKDYMSHGFRHVAEHEATLELGRRNPLDITAGVAKSIHALRATPFDKEFLRLQAQSPAREVILPPLKGKSPEWMRQARTNKLRRLSVLVEWGLAREVRTGVWSVDPDLLEILSARAKRIEIEKRVTKHLGLSPARLQPLVVHDTQSAEPVNVYGFVVGSGLVSELGDAKFILVSGSDGATHYMPLGRFSESSGFECRVGDVVAVTTASRKS